MPESHTSDDIDQLIAELHASASASASPTTGASLASVASPPAIASSAAGSSSTTGAGPVTGDTMRLERWLRILADRGGSDLLLVAGAPPSVRVDGRVRPLADGPLDGVDIEESLMPALAPHARRIYRQAQIADSSFRVQGLGRYRINLHRERGRAAAAVRVRGAD